MDIMEKMVEWVSSSTRILWRNKKISARNTKASLVYLGIANKCSLWM
jgi:hypothetical protein